MNEKRIIVVVTYEAYVPEDMKISQVEENIEDLLRSRFDSFRVDAEDYHNEDKADPFFKLDQVIVCTECSIRSKGE